MKAVFSIVRKLFVSNPKASYKKQMQMYRIFCSSQKSKIYTSFLQLQTIIYNTCLTMMSLIMVKCNLELTRRMQSEFTLNRVNRLQLFSIPATQNGAYIWFASQGSVSPNLIEVCLTAAVFNVVLATFEIVFYETFSGFYTTQFILATLDQD